MKRLYVGLIAVAALAFALWLARDHFLRSWAASWTPNIATEAITILVTVAVVDRIVQARERIRFKPRVDRAMRDVGSAFRMMVRAVAWDYTHTHVETFKALPATSLGVLEHWLDNEDEEDAERPSIHNANQDPHVLANALFVAPSLKHSREEDRDVLEPDVVAEIDAFEESTQLAFTIWGGYPAEPEERARAAIHEVVQATRALGQVLVNHDEQWLEEGEDTLSVPGSWGTEMITKGEPPAAGI